MAIVAVLVCSLAIGFSLPL